MTQSNPSTPDQTTLERRAFRTAAILLAVTIGVILFYLIINWQLRAWQMYVLTGAMAAYAVTTLVSIRLIRAGRIQTGAWVYIIGMYPLGPIATLFMTDVSLTVSLVFAGMIFVTASQALSAKQTRIATAISIGIGILNVLLDQLPLDYRLTLPVMQTFIPIAGGIVVLGALFFVARRAWFAGQINISLRLTFLILLVVIPVIVATSYILVSRASNLIESQSATELQNVNQGVVGNVTIWVNQQTQALDTLVNLPDIVSMDGEKQTPILESFGKGYPQAYLIQTLDSNGVNVARSDGGELRDYSDRAYFTGPASGEPLTFQSLTSRTTGEPAVCLSSPIENLASNFIGVGTICTNLTELSQGVKISKIGETGFAFLVDEQNQVIAHPDPTYTAELSDFSTYPPVAMLRDGQRGQVTFTDAEGEQWHAYVDELENGWGVVTLQSDAELLGTLNTFLIIAVVTFVFGVIFAAVAIWWLIRQSVRPVQELTSVAQAISTGDLTQTASEEREDEFGILAKAFNAMTTQLRDLIGSLEGQVSSRTRALETSTEVSRRLSTILDQDTLVREVVEQLTAAFNYYHAHIYLFDERKQNLIVVGGTGDAGRSMLAQGHKIEPGRGLVGRAAANNEIVLIPDVMQAEGWLPNPLLPDTLSEIAVPIAVGDEVLGVLDVQHNVTNGLTDEDAALIQSIANQVGIAVQNAQTYQRTQQQALREARITTINQRIQSAATIDDVLQIAISELGQALEAERANVEVSLVHQSNGESSAS